MSKIKHNQLKIKFNHDWYYCCLPANAADIDINAIANSNDYHWINIQLPHILPDKKEEHDDNSNQDQQNWWYRKHFEWEAYHQNQAHGFYLIFEVMHDYRNNENTNNNYSSLHNLTVWLNQIEIFSNSFQSSSVSINLTEQLNYKDELENNNGHNTLIVRCTDTSLSLHVYLLIPRNAIHAIEHKCIDVNKRKTDNTLPIQVNRVLDYLVDNTDTDGMRNAGFYPKMPSVNRAKQGNHNQSNEQHNDDTKKMNRRLSLETTHVLDYLVKYKDPESDSKLQSSTESNQQNPPDIIITEDQDQTHEHRINYKDYPEELHVPRLNVVMLIVGTRGDVQPFVAFGKTLRAAGHRVRLATHEKFRKLVREHGLEFYPIASNPEDLMAFMVRNGGIIPSMGSIVEGDLKKKRRDIWAILQSTWLACTDIDGETSVPFTAEVIIANPPSFGHIHCAQKLQIPLHMMFTMPWSPTTVFPHAFYKVDYSKVPKEKVNLISYGAIDTLTWSSMHDLANKFRRETLDLPPLHTRQAIRMLIDEQIPHTYCWSPSLVPAPHDWPSHIDVAGYFFLDTNIDQYKPPHDLLTFLGLDHDDSENQEKLEPPIYIGFGSITGNDSNRLFKVVLDALVRTGYRGLLSGFNKNNDQLPKNVFKIDDVPHDWLFQYVSAVCHHGGAGTTGAGLRAGKPTIIVPFFGDQFFWGNVVEKCGAGPSPLPGKHVTVDELVEAFKHVHTPAIRLAAEHMRDVISHEDGCATALRIFHAHLPLSRMRSDLEPTFAACYRVDEFDLQVSRPVAQVLIATGALMESQFHPHTTREWTYIYDHRVHVPTSGVLKHTQKAFSHIFVHSADGMKRAISSDNLLTGVVVGLGGACKHVGKGVGHLSIGVLSLYGELTDVLDRVPSLYDPYKDIDAHERPRVTDFRSGFSAAGHSLAYGWKDGITGFVRKPRVGYRRHGIVGGATGIAVASANGFVKPAVGSLASVTWLSRGLYASAKKKKKMKKKRKSQTNETHALINKLSIQSPRSSISSISSNDEEHSNDENHEQQYEDIPQNIRFAAIVSGYPAEICQHILDEFDKVKKYQEKIDALVPNRTDKHRLKNLYRRYRSDSDSAL